MGKSIADARNGGSSGCVEVGAFGKEAYILTGYFNLPKVLELTLNNGVDPRTGKQIGLETGDPEQFGSFEQLFEAYRRQLNYLIDVKMRGNNIIERLYATYMPAPFLSILIDDCIARGRDYHDGGPRYNTNYIQGVGLGTITDALTALKYHVFDRQTFSMSDLLAALRANFEGHEPLRQTLWQRTPKYGNDDDYADDVMRSVFEAYFQAVDGRPNTKGGRYRINLLPTTVHVYFGSVMGATPDGRKAGLPLSEGISPVQGADRQGPTAVLKSAAKMDHGRTGGTLLNMKFNPQVLEGEDGLDNLKDLIRSYFRLDGHHIQFNVVDAETLREGPGPTRGIPEPDRPRRRLQRLLRGPRQRPPKRNHRPHGAEGVLERNGDMPVISRFFGIVIFMFWREHAPPHFHAKYQDQEITVEIETGRVAGTMVPKAVTLIQEWRESHKDELLGDWRLAEQKKSLKRIAPLE